MRLAVVAAVLVVLLACVVALEAAPSARDEAELGEALERQVKRELEVFEREVFPDEDQRALYKRGFWRDLWRKFKETAISTVASFAVKYLAGLLSGKRDLDLSQPQQ